MYMLQSIEVIRIQLTTDCTKQTIVAIFARDAAQSTKWGQLLIENIGFRKI